MGLKLVTEPATLPVSIDELKAHSRITFTDDDAVVEIYLRAAVNHAERFTGRAFIDQTWDYYADAFPLDDKPIDLPKPPLIEVSGVYYRATSGDETEFSSSNYLVDDAAHKARVALAYGQSWPTIQERVNAVRVRFRAGYLDVSSPEESAVPVDIKAAIMLTAGTLYQNRESVVVGASVVTLPFGAQELLRPHRVHTAMA